MGWGDWGLKLRAQSSTAKNRENDRESNIEFRHDLYILCVCLCLQKHETGPFIDKPICNMRSGIRVPVAQVARVLWSSHSVFSDCSRLYAISLILPLEAGISCLLSVSSVAGSWHIAKLN